MFSSPIPSLSNPSQNIQTNVKTMTGGKKLSLFSILLRLSESENPSQKRQARLYSTSRTINTVVSHVACSLQRQCKKQSEHSWNFSSQVESAGLTVSNIIFFTYTLRKFDLEVIEGEYGSPMMSLLLSDFSISQLWFNTNNISK